MNVRLRRVEPSDIEVFYDHQADPVAAAMAVFPSREHDAHVAQWQRILANPTGVALTIEADGSLAGNIVSWLDGEQRLIGYWIGRQFWGRGIASQAVRLLVTEHLPERPLWAHVAASNAGSIKVLERNGFVLAPEQPGEPAEDGVVELLYVLR